MTRRVQALVLGVMLASAYGEAVQAGDITRYRAPAVSDGLLGTDAAAPLYPLQYSTSAYFSYAHNPLVWVYGDGTYEPVINRQLTLEVAGAVGVIQLVDMGVSLPVLLSQRGDSDAGFGSLSGAGLGDLRLLPRVYLIPERSFGFGLSVVPEITLPTGSAEKLVGDPSAAFRPRFIASIPSGLGRATASLSYRLRKNATASDVTLGDELELHLGADVSLAPWALPASALVELAASTASSRPFRGDGLSSAEALLGARTRLFADLVLTAGVGVGLTRGLGTPAFRLLLGVAVQPLPADSDLDGIPDAVDACPNDPEDYDQFADLDGCPDRDNDDDGIPDVEDACPDEPEDLNAIDDEDGCPESTLAPSDDDELPPLDTDNDGIVDHHDRCPEDPEDRDGYQDLDGCPDGGVPKTEYVREQRIDIRETVLFESGKSTIKAESKLLLNQVAEQIRSHPEIKQLRIEGHTDNRGGALDNLYLSQDRADAVRRYLISRGVAKEILTAEGYGLTRPIDTNDTTAGRMKNRRVEFVIVETRTSAP